MSSPAITIHAPAVQLQVSSLEDLMKQQKIRAYELIELLDLNDRTVRQRIKKPEQFTIGHLLKLAKILNVSPHQLLDLVENEVATRPAAKPTPIATAAREAQVTTPVISTKLVKKSPQIKK